MTRPPRRSLGAFQVLACIAGWLGPAGLVAQQPVVGAPSAAAVLASLAEAHGVAAIDGELVAVGRDYKAHFVGSGVRFVPFFGDAAPRSHELHLQLRTIRRGAEASPVRLAATAEKVGDATVVLQRGCCVERYDARPAGLEQSFEFPAPPPGAGDLVVACDFRTDLVVEAAGETPSFALPGVGSITIGAVTGIDARGWRHAGTVRVVDGQLELALPAAFVDAAVWPLVLDPVIGTAFAFGGANDNTSPDVCYDPVTQDYVVAFVRKVSALDHDVFAQRIDAATGALVGSVLAIDVSFDMAVRPRLATVALHSRCLVVWQNTTSVFGPWDVQSRILTPSTNGVSARTAIATTAADETEPCVGGDATNGGDKAVVLWNDGTGIQAASVTVGATGAAVVGSPGTVANSGLSTAPCISKICGTTGNFLLAWRQASLAGGSEVQARLVSRTLLGASPVITALSGGDFGAPACDTAGLSWLLVAERFETGSTVLRDVVAARLVDVTGLAVANTAVVEDDAGQDESAPDVAWLGQRYAVTFCDRRPSFGDDIGMWLVNPDCTTCNSKVVMSGLGSLAREYGARIAGRNLYAPTQNDGFVAYVEASNLPPYTNQLVGQRIASLGTGSSVNLGGGCGNGGFGGSDGPFAIGNTAFRFMAVNLEPTAMVFLGIGFPGPTLACSGCTLLQPVSFEFKVQNGGIASSPFAVPCEPSWIGLQLETQWLSFFTSTSPCPLAAGLAASNRAQFTLGN